MKPTLTQTEQKIVELVHAIDILTQEMNVLIPIDVNSENLQKFKEMYNYREDLHITLYDTVSSYVKDLASDSETDDDKDDKDDNGDKEDEIDWRRISVTLQRCSEALDLLRVLRHQEKISSEENRILSCPLSDELQNIHRFIIGGLLKKEQQCLNDGQPTNPLSFNI